MRGETRFDKFNFDEADLIEVERNYRLYRRGKGIYHRLYRCPGNTLDMCQGDGIIDTDNTDRLPLEVIILLMDAEGNQSRIGLILVNDDDPDDDRLVTGEPLISCSSWGNPAHDRISLDIFDKYLRLSGPPGLGGINVNSAFNINLVTRLTGGREVAAWTPSGEIIDPLKITAIDHTGRPIEDCLISLYPVLPFESCVIESDDGKIRAEIPLEAVYDTTWMRIIHEPSYIVPGEIESVYRIEPRDQPLNGKVLIKIACDENIVARSGWGVYYLDRRSGWTFLDNAQEDNFLTAPALSWETFGLVKDADMPYLDVQKPVDNETLRSADMSLYAVVRDTTSGIIAEDIIVTIDGKKVPAEYDPPRKRILYRPWQELSTGSHELTVFIKDRVGNSTVRSLNFNIIQ